MTAAFISERGLVLAPRGRDAAVACAMMAEVEITCEPVADLITLLREIEAGAGFVLLTQEALATSDLSFLMQWIARQEQWSDLPFILLTTRGGGLESNPAARRYLDILTNVTFLERPFHPTTLISLAQAALRGRRRQYEARARMEALRLSETRLRDLNATLERRVTEALAERKLFADVVALADASFQVLDRDFRYLAINAAAVADYRRIFGVEPKVGQTMHEVLGRFPDQLAAALAVWRRALDGEGFEQTSTWSAPGFELRWYEMQFRPLHDALGRQVGAYLFGQDVTARVRDQKRLIETAAQLHEAQKLETLGQLTGGVAHDFNNLLMPILAALEIARKRYDGDARATRLFDGALQSVERAKTLVQRLLGFARRQTLEKRPVDLAGLIANMADLIRSSIGANIEMRLDVGRSKAIALIDPNQLELAILNLCINARDAMPEGGVLTLQLSPQTVATGDEADLTAGEYHRLSVIDTGVGMDRETLRRAIEPFFSTKGVGKGTGLGLSMVHGLAAQLGGGCKLTSAPGRGTRIDIYLPRAPAAADPAQQTNEAPLSAPRRPLTILLVDDEPLVRAGTAEMLRNSGHRVIEASGAAEALERLRAETVIDAVVTDYTMPGLNGVQLGRRIAQLRAQVPVLVITGFAGADLDFGFPILAKPFGHAALHDALQKLTHEQAAPASYSELQME